MITLYDLAPSINAYKVRLMLSLLNLPYTASPVAVMEGQHKKPEYLRGHPFGQVPMLVDHEDRSGSLGSSETLWDSQGILVYLARKYGGEQWLPQDAAGEARVTSWLSLAANEVHNSLFHARVTKLFGMKTGLELETLQKRGKALLSALNTHLTDRQWLAANHATIADIAVFPGVARAHEGGVDLENFPAVKAWVTRVEQLPGYRPINAKA